MHVALFVTCLADLLRPSVAHASIKLLEAAGCRVSVPLQQTCCGQPAYNNGAKQEACAIARQVIEAFAGYEYIVVPSASCAGMLKLHYPALFDGDAQWQPRAQDFSRRCHELTHFLVHIAGCKSVPGRQSGRITCHDACSALRELQIKSEPRELLASIPGLALQELAEAESCCGFGGTFCVKYPEISLHMVDAKIRQIEDSRADMLVSTDLGCLINIASRLRHLNKPVRVFHIAEVLADMTDSADIRGIRD